MISVIKRNSSLLLFLAIFALATFLRSYAISDRPFHNDEGVNYFFVRDVLSKGLYNYSHENYHGPSYFYLLTAFCHILGTSDLSIRLASAFSSLVLMALVYFSFNFISKTSRLLSIILLGVSTTFLYYSRYSIHETLLVLSCIMGLCFAYRWILFNKANDVLLFTFSIALSISTKETFIIHLAAMLGALFICFPLKLIFQTLCKSSKSISIGIFICLITIFAFYSGSFQSIEGVRELFMGVPQWIGRGHSDVGHHKPFSYYYNVILRVEPFVLLSILPLVDFFFRFIAWIYKSNNKKQLVLNFFRNGFNFEVVEEIKASYLFSFYALASFIAYSYVPYKTPWLIINITVPAIIGLCIYLTTLIKTKSLYYANVLILVIVSCCYSLQYNFKQDSLGFFGQYLNSKGVVGEDNPLAYVHTSDGMVEISKKISAYAYAHPGSRILIAVTAYWPLPYYLREFESQLMYAQGADPEKYFDEYNIIIANKEMIKEHQGWTREYIRLSDNQESQVYFKN